MAFTNSVKVDMYMVRARLLASGTTIDAEMSEAPQSDTPAVGFSAKDENDAPVPILAAEIDGLSVLLTVPETYRGKPLWLSYDSATGDIAGEDFALGSFTDRPVANFSEAQPAAVTGTMETDNAAQTFDAVGEQQGLPQGGLLEYYNWNTTKYQDAALTVPVNDNDQKVAYVQGLYNSRPMLSSSDTESVKPRNLLVPYPGFYFGYSAPFTAYNVSGQRWLHTAANVPFDAKKKQIVALSYSLTKNNSDFGGPAIDAFTGSSAVLQIRVLPATGKANLTVRAASANTTNVTIDAGAMATLTKRTIILVYTGTTAHLWVDGVKLGATVNVGTNTVASSAFRLRLTSFAATGGDFIAHKFGFWNGDTADTSDEAIGRIHNDLMAA